MINPNEFDIGIRVSYCPGFGDKEYGVITSITEDFVFVRYAKQHPSANGQATKREDLEWA
jgi:hypothetical protein